MPPVPESGTAPNPGVLINVLGVVYAHYKTADGGDLYLTRFGNEHAALLQPENWYEKAWFEENREKLQGTSAVHRIPTREVDGRSIDLVVKNSRVGEDVPLDTHTLQEFLNAEFNSPWEEFALVMEMREGAYGPQDVVIRLQEPLAIYIPPERLQFWQTGRSRDRLRSISARHPGVDIDILRQYKLIYGWLPGKDVVELLGGQGVPEAILYNCLSAIQRRTIADLERKGYAVADMKPVHVIIDPAESAAVEALAGRPDLQAHAVRDLVEQGKYSVIDYELLLRTTAHEQSVKYARRHSYLDEMRDRFTPSVLPPHLRSTVVMDVPYIWGHVESTGGQLWVVGTNPRLFDYFLPERWRRTPCRRLSENNEVFYTLTKDNVHLVWKTSRVGEVPAENLYGACAEAAVNAGFNSPFEEFNIAQLLNDRGVPTVYVRAVYMTGSVKVEPSGDLRRYLSQQGIIAPDGLPALRQDRNYITIRGFFNGPDSFVASHESGLYRPVDLVQALAEGIIDRGQFERIFSAVVGRSRSAGFDASLLMGNDILLAIDPAGRVTTGDDGLAQARICNFELIRNL